MTRPKPATLASMLHSFFIEYLPRQRALSPHTLRSYRDSLNFCYSSSLKGMVASPNSQSKTDAADPSSEIVERLEISATEGPAAFRYPVAPLEVDFV